MSVDVFQGSVDPVVEELLQMVDEGLMEMGVSADGETVWWPTKRGCVVLGMHSDGPDTPGTPDLPLQRSA